MGKASSSKKVARAARAGGRRASGGRQRDLKFPALIGVIVVLGGLLVGFAANDRKSEATDVPPVINVDHWHAAYGVYICGEFQPNVPTFESPVGIHTHGDGVIHIHPFSDGGAGENATLGVFLDGAGIDLSDTTLKMNDKTWKEGKDQCDGKDAELVVAQWKDVENPDSKPALIRRDFNDIRFRENGEGYTIAFVPEGTTDIPKPPSAANLAELGAADSNTATTGAPGDTGTTAPVDPNATDTTATDPNATATTAPADPTATTAPGG
ncbi:MAG TPA: hypothetical protein VH479_17775 [Acidimicrobiales bacterium]